MNDPKPIKGNDQLDNKHEFGKYLWNTKIKRVK